jgi:hypothetical protein
LIEVVRDIHGQPAINAAAEVGFERGPLLI